MPSVYKNSTKYRNATKDGYIVRKVAISSGVTKVGGTLFTMKSYDNL